jgi:prepilin-type N-terminal cleavage/methylation domain-containing protein
MNINKNNSGFTITELLVVIVVISILATISYVSFSNISSRTKISAVKSDLTNAYKQLEIDRIKNNSYPTSIESANEGLGLQRNNNLTYNYSVVGSNFCLSATYLNDPLTSHVISSDNNAVTQGSCANSWKKVSSGANGHCAINYKNETFCWGANAAGQIGDGTYIGRITPTKIASGAIPSDVYLIDIDQGEEHTCGLGSNGKMYCWGANWTGQIGINSTSPRFVLTPTLVQNGAIPADVTIKSFAASAYNTCAIGSNNATYCWGYGSDGQNGDGNSTRRTVPTTTIRGDMPVGVYLTSIKSNVETFCGLASNSRVYCWGGNYFGAIGNDSTINVNRPTAVLSGSMPADVVIKDLAVGGYHACAVSTLNNIYCWGYNSNGSLSNGTFNQSGIPTTALKGEIPSDAVIESIYSGWYVTCVITDNTETYCWGENINQTLGNNTMTNSNTPVKITNLVIPDDTKILSVEIAVSSACAITTKNGSIYCWGDNMSGELGLGITNNRNSPTLTHDGEIPNGVSVIKSVTSNFFGCLLASNEKAYCWGHTPVGLDANTPIEIEHGSTPSNVTFKDISAGWSDLCLIGSDEWLYCLGSNNHGSVGNGSSTAVNSLVPISRGAIPEGVTIKKVSSGGYHNCVLGSDKKVYCWGHNTYGSLGNGNTTASSVPVEVLQGAIPDGITIEYLADMSSGGYHNCVIGSNNSTYCWGRNNYGQLGDNSVINKTSPVLISAGNIPSGTYARSVSSGIYNTCINASNNLIYCWGLNDKYQLGWNTLNYVTTPRSTARGEIPTGIIKQLITGRDRTCAIASNDKAYCWGSDEFGSLGHGDWGDYSYLPRMVVNGESVNGTFKSISPGFLFTCGTSVDNKSYCWGSGYRAGLLGNNSNDHLGYPQPIAQF